MAGEARDQAKTIPAAIKRVMIAVFTIYFTLPWIALSALPVRCDARGENCTTLLGVAKEEGGFASNPMLGIVQAMELGSLQVAAELYVGILAVTILVAATNAGVLGVSRLVYLDGAAPADARRDAPAAPALPRRTWGSSSSRPGLRRLAARPGGFLGALYAFGAMLSFSMAHLALLRLRVIQPDLPRPYRSPGRVRVRGHELPPFALAGIAGTGPVAARRERARPHRRRRRERLARCSGSPSTSSTGAGRASTSPRRTRWRSPQPVVDHEAEYDSVLVHVDDGGYDEQLIATAAKLAARKRRGIHVLVTIIVPNALADRRADARRRGGRGVDHRAGQAAGRAARLRATGRRSARARRGGGSSRRRRTCAPRPS